MLSNRNDQELNFIERRRQWQSNVQKPLSRRTLIMVLPALILCVFVMMSAPYLKLLFEELSKGETYKLTNALDISEPVEKPEKAGPPPSPEQVMAEHYRREFEREGFDWQTKPKLDLPELGFAKERPIELKPLDVELPVTATAAEAMAKE